MKKKMLCVVLVLALVAGLLPAGIVWAEEPAVQAQGTANFKLYTMINSQWGYDGTLGADNTAFNVLRSKGDPKTSNGALGSRFILNDMAETGDMAKDTWMYGGTSKSGYEQKYITFVVDAQREGINEYWVSVNTTDIVGTYVRGFQLYVDGELFLDESENYDLLPYRFTSTDGTFGWRYMWTLPQSISLAQGEHVFTIRPSGNSDSFRFGGMLVSETKMDVNTHIADPEGAVLDGESNRFKENPDFLDFDALTAQEHMVPAYAKQPDFLVKTEAGPTYIDVTMTKVPNSGAAKEYEIFCNGASKGKVPATTQDGKQAVSCRIGQLLSNTSYDIQVVAYDCIPSADAANVQGNTMIGALTDATKGRVQSETAVVTTLPSEDTTPPVFTEGEITVSETSYSSCLVTFPKAIDENGIFEYQVLAKRTGTEQTYFQCGVKSALGVTQDRLTASINGLSPGKSYDIKVIAVDNGGAMLTAELEKESAVVTTGLGSAVPEPEVYTNPKDTDTGATQENVPAGIHIVLNYAENQAKSNFTFEAQADSTSAATGADDNNFYAEPIKNATSDHDKYVGRVVVPNTGNPDGVTFQLMMPYLRSVNNNNVRGCSVKIDGQYLKEDGSRTETEEEAVVFGGRLSDAQLGAKVPAAATGNANMMFWEWGPVVTLTPGVHDVEVVVVQNGSGVRFHSLLFTSAIGYDWTKLISMNNYFRSTTNTRKNYAATLGAVAEDFEAPRMEGEFNQTVKSSALELSWTAVDNRRVAGYQVSYRPVDAQENKVVYTPDPKIVLTGLVPETRYQVSVVAFDMAGNSSAPFTEEMTTLQDTTLPVFTGPVKTIVYESTAALSWNEATDDSPIVKYIVDVKRNGEDYTNPVFHGESETTSITVTGLVSNTEYQARVAAIPQYGPGTNGESFIESPVFRTKMLLFPWFAEDAQITNQGFGEEATAEQLENQLHLGWTPAIYSAEGETALYDVYVNVQGESLGQPFASGLTEPTCTVTGLSPLTSYHITVKVRSANPAHGFDPSAGVLQVIEADLATLDATGPVFGEGEVNAQEDPVSYGTINLTWPAASDVSGIKEYQVFYKISADEDWPATPAQTMSADATAAQITGLEKDTEYDFKVVAVANGGTPDRTERIKEKVKTANYFYSYFPENAKLVKGEKSALQLNLIWTSAICGEDAAIKYRVLCEGEILQAGITKTGATLPADYAAKLIEIESYIEGMPLAPEGVSNKLSGTFTLDDVTPPSIEGTVQVSDIMAESAVLSWNPATDDSGAVTYQIYVNGSQVAETGDPRYTLTKLAPDMRYLILISAVDASGNTTNFPAIDLKTPAGEMTAEPTYSKRMPVVGSKELSLAGSPKATLSENLSVIDPWGAEELIWLTPEKTETKYTITIPESGNYYVMTRGALYSYASEKEKRNYTISVEQKSNTKPFLCNDSDKPIRFLCDEVPSTDDGPVIQVPDKPIYLEAGEATVKIYTTGLNARFDFLVLGKEEYGQKPAIFKENLTKEEFDTYYKSEDPYLYAGSAALQTIDNSSMLLTWTPDLSLKENIKPGTEVSYKVMLGEDTVAVLPENARQCMVTGLEPGKPYQIKLMLLLNGNASSKHTITRTAQIQSYGDLKIMDSLADETAQSGKPIQQVQVSMTNLMARPQTVRVMLVRYHDNAMVEKKELIWELQPGKNIQKLSLSGSAMYRLPNASLHQDGTVKLFLWDGTNGYMPLN